MKTFFKVILLVLKKIALLLISILKFVLKNPKTSAWVLFIFWCFFLRHICVSQEEIAVKHAVSAWLDHDANDFFVYLDNKSKQWIQYGRGSKFWLEIDCSWLISRFAVWVWFITQDEAIHKYNAQKRYSVSIPKDIKDIERWDLLFWASEDKPWYMSHVSVIIKYTKNTIEIIDAHPTYWVSRRTISYEWNKSMWNDGNVYLLFPTTNPILDTSKWTRQYQWEFSATSYVPRMGVVDINSSWSPTVTASWLPLLDEYAGKVIACPKKYPLNTQFYVAWLWLVDCKDRWGLITMAWDTNSRGNIAKYNHIDIFAWLDTAKIDRSKRMTDVYY